MNPIAPAVWYVALAAVLLPVLVAGVLFAMGRRRPACIASLCAAAAAIVAASFLLLDALVGFGKMVAFYFGVGIAVAVGALLGNAVRRL